MTKKIVVFISLLSSIIVFCICNCTPPKEEEENTILLATNTRPLNDIKFAVTKERIERGEYLTNGILKCLVCHSPRDTTQPGFPPIETMKGAGAILWDNKQSRMVAPNITPDIKTGAGSWTDDMFARSIREGIGHDGRALSLPMYWNTFRELSDEDLASVIIYLRTLKPVKNKLPKRRLSPDAELELQKSSKLLAGPVKEQDLSDMITRGRYFIRTADCVGCHTSWYKRNPGFLGGGNKLKKWYDTSFVFSSNISPHETGLKGWTEDMFIRMIRTGKNGTLNPVMPWVAYKNLTDEDLKAIFMALQNAPPVNHRVINSLKPGYCKVCEQEHGYGEHNEIKPINAVPFDAKAYPDFVGKYVHPEGYIIDITLDDNKLMVSEGGNPVELLPVAGNKFEALGFSTPISFKRDASGNVKCLVSYWIGEDVFEKQ